MTLLDRINLIGSCLDDGIIGEELAVELLVEGGNGGLSRSGAVTLLARRPHRIPPAGNPEPLRDRERGEGRG